MVYYSNGACVGLDRVASLGDGTTIAMRWFRAYPQIKTNKIAYNIYYSTIKEDIFVGPPKYVSIDDAV